MKGIRVGPSNGRGGYKWYEVKGVGKFTKEAKARKAAGWPATGPMRHIAHGSDEAKAIEAGGDEVYDEPDGGASSRAAMGVGVSQSQAASGESSIGTILFGAIVLILLFICAMALLSMAGR